MESLNGLFFLVETQDYTCESIISTVQQFQFHVHIFGEYYDVAKDCTLSLTCIIIFINLGNGKPMQIYFSLKYIQTQLKKKMKSINKDTESNNVIPVYFEVLTFIGHNINAMCFNKCF